MTVGIPVLLVPGRGGSSRITHDLDCFLFVVKYVVLFIEFLSMRDSWYCFFRFLNPRMVLHFVFFGSVVVPSFDVVRD
jgi:hypothetical protein